jgi:hypothetical protein
MMAEFVGGICEVCLGNDGSVIETGDGREECGSCRSYREWYESLTVEEQKAEHEMMAVYVEETERRGDA